MSPDINDIKRNIEGQRDLLSRIITAVPGFQGYVETGEKYDADRVIRNFMADKILAFKQTVSGAMRDMQKSVVHDVLSRLDSLGTVLERILKKCQFADYGKKSFTGVTMTPEQQDKLLAYDWNLIFRLDEIGTEFDRLSGVEPGAVSGIVADILKKLNEFEKEIDGRKSVILEVL